MARVKQDLRESLAAAGLLARIGKDRIYMTLPTRSRRSRTAKAWRATTQCRFHRQ